MPEFLACGAMEAALEGSESAGLIADEREVRPSGIRRRRWVMGGVAGICLASAVLVRKAVTPCQLGHMAMAPEAGRSIVSLVESSPDDLLHTGKHVDQSAVARWLAESNEKGQVITNHMKTSLDQASMRQLIVMGHDNATEARALVQRALGKAPAQWHDHRKGLLKALKTMAAVGALRSSKTPAQKASLASCTFNTLQATTQLAALAASINDAAKTCVNVKDEKTAKSWYGKVCAINVEQVMSSISAMAAMLSLAANNCADSLMPNLDALCAGSVSGLIQSLMDFSIGAELTASSCKKKLTDAMPRDVTPSNIGQAGTPEVFEHRRLGDEDSSAHARRLLFGGGRESTATFCAVDVSSMAWYLAQAGIAINTAANQKAGAVCPPKNFWGGSVVKGRFYKQSEAFCAVSITGAIYGFLQAIKYIQMAFVQCSDTWSFAAMCGAGIDGMLAAMDGVAFAGSSMHLSCDELRNAPALAPRTQAALVNNALGNSGNFGRRLATEAPEGVDDLQSRFATPEDAWKSIGFDVSSPDSDLRSVEPLQPSAEHVLGLLREEAPTPAAPEPRGLLGGQHFCTN